MPACYVVDVKHGNSTVVVNEQVVIIDTGNRSYLLEFLDSKNIRKIDTILLSHADEDHIGGVMALLAAGIEVKAIYLNPDATKKSAVWDDLIYVLDSLDHKGELYFGLTLTSDLNGQCDCGDVQIEVLAPSKYLVGKGCGSKDQQGRTIQTNSISAVIRLIYQETPVVLLPGDIDHVGLANVSRDVKARLLVFPHHGGHCGKDIKVFTQEICKKVQPEKIIFSIGKNTDKFPLQDVIETISFNLRNTCMYTTNHSDIFQVHIENISEPPHQNDVGNVHIDFTKEPLELIFTKT
jgi:competence protein ComEC